MYYIFIMIIAMLIPKIWNNKKFCYIVIFSLMGIVSGLRSSNVGIDTKMYHYLYYWTNDHELDWVYIDDGWYIEIGSRALMVVSSYIFDDPQTYIFLSSFLTYIFMAIFCYRCIKNDSYWIAPIIIMGFGFYSYSLCVVRQALAIAIACNALPYFSDKQLFKGTLIILLASLFHFGVIVLLPLYYILNIIKESTTLSRRKLMLFIITILSVIIATLPMVINNLSLPLNEKYLSYVTAQNESVVTYYYMSMLVIYLYILKKCLLINNDIGNKDKSVLMTTNLCVLLIFGIFFSILSLQIDIFNRFVNVFDVYICVMLPMIINNEVGDRKFYTKLLVLMFCFASMIYFVIGDRWGSGNYEFFL